MGEFYTGFVADHYDLLVPEDETRMHGLFRSFIERDGQPALELACGTGRHLLEVVADGLDVEGLDSSPDMLERCRAKAAAANLGVTLHHQRMESFAIDRAFRTIYCATSSFLLLPDDDAVARALANVHRHLEPGGRFVAALHLPADFAENAKTEWRVTREATRPEDGATVRCLSRLLDVSADKQSYETVIRYQLLSDNRLDYEEDRIFLLHWHTQEQFASLLAGAGFVEIQALRGTGKPSQPDDRLFTFVAERARS